METPHLNKLIGFYETHEQNKTLYPDGADVLSELRDIKQVLNIADVVECAGNKRTPHEKRSEVLSNPWWEYEAGLYKHFKWGWKTLDEAYQIVTS